ncbi:PAS domain-containing hybrid sensor histidine kinase/response regulator [Tellurirhabdus bombi]|uniref:PAS domain-containing hybrid sensor histidine kinase/response regulator n=1 Tax=Tellurirhabdus bombi TaxID=2907205 RepID=UPI001F1E49C2|nr:PAS domain-containing hybrid sensor histidine kinase/response regulator [Tellurirhabdus bombi]
MKKEDVWASPDEQRYRRLLESVDDIIYTTSPDGYFLYVNPAVEKILGYAKQDIVGKRFTELIHPDFQETVLSFYEDMLTCKKESTYLEFPVVTHAQQIIWIGQTVRCIPKGESGFEFAAVARDITEKYRAQELLQQSEEKYRSIMNNMELGLLEVDNNHTIIRAYERFCKMVGYTEEELIGKKATDLIVVPEYMALLEEKQMNRMSGEADSYEMPIRCKDGAELWVIISGTPIRDSAGNVIGSLGIHYDISARRKLELELANAKRIAEEAQLAEKQFLANMSHEIRTPLNAIIGMSHLLYDTQPTKQQLEYFEIIQSSANFLHSLISDLLDMAKIEAGRLEIIARPFDLVGFLRKIQKMYQIRLRERPISLHVMIDTQITGEVLGDELMLNQILLNLLGNAEKFTEKGSVRLSVLVLEETDKELILEFQVTDTGIGIADDKVDVIFQKFKQIETNEGHKHKGTGLGLAITKELVEVQGGSISVSSRLGRGTTFTFTLPFTKIKSSASEGQEVVQPGPGTHLKHRRVLIVEDNIMNQKYVEQLLRKWEINFELATDGRKAVELAKNQVYDAILMDIQMPIMDGYEATIAIRTVQNINQNTPIIALTASALNDHKKTALAVGMNEFLTKPFSPNQLWESLNRLIPTEAGEEVKVEPVVEEVTQAAPAVGKAYNFADLFDGDKEYIGFMLESFLTDIVPEVPLIKSYVDAQNWESLKKIAHKLRPAFGMLGLTDLEKKFATMEKSALENPEATKLKALQEEIQREVEQITGVVQQQLDELNKA